jgi:hypothetical protein
LPRLSLPQANSAASEICHKIKGARAMTDKFDRQYDKLFQALKDPEQKSQLHDDPDVGHILKKLSVQDVEELRQMAQLQSRQPCCPPGIEDV